MNISRKINQKLNLVGLNISRIPSSLFKKEENDFILPISKDDYQVLNDKVFLKRLNIDIPKQVDHPFIIEYHHAVRIVEKLNGKFYYDSTGDLKVKVENVELYISDPEILFIISEVFGGGSYNIINNKRDVVVIDIGMNVATTSLFFASKGNVEKIYSYELFPITYENAFKNIQLNNFGSKIQPHKYGLGKEDAKFVLPYSTKQKGRMGLNGLPKDNEYEDVIMEEVQIKKVSNEIRFITEKSQDKYIICKIDCEGAEYEIMDDLESNRMVDKVNVYLIEWHYKKPNSIIDALQNNNFTIFYSTFFNDDAGMIYAVKN